MKRKETLKTEGHVSPIIVGNDNKLSISVSFSNSGSPSNFLENRDNQVVMVFDGSDTLSLAQMFCDLQRVGVQETAVDLWIEGIDNFSNCPTSSWCAYKGVIWDGYIRSLKVMRPDDEVVVGVGGSNATTERVAAQKVIVVLNKELLDTLPPYFRLYNLALFDSLEERDLQSLYRTEQLESAIALAKKLRNSFSSEILLGYLNGGFPPEKMGLICEAFRSLEELCKSEEKPRLRATTALLDYIKSHADVGERALSVVYAIESLGYVAPGSADSRELVCKRLSDFLRADRNAELHRDVRLATFVTMKRNLSKAIDLDIIKQHAGYKSDYTTYLQQIEEDIHRNLSAH